MTQERPPHSPDATPHPADSHRDAARRSETRAAWLLAALAVLAFAAWWWTAPVGDSANLVLESAEQAPPTAGLKVPNEWFFLQRAWPHPDINQAARLAAVEQATRLRSEAEDLQEPWQPVGPSNIGGRIADVAAHPTDPLICYAGAAAGGVFKTTNAGQNWVPLMDQEASLSIGSIALDPNDPETLYVGTGEPNGGGGSVTYGGTGVLKSTNGGATWESIGLAATRYIGRVKVDPSNSSRVFVAALGSLFSTGPDRGIYRSTDSGGSWEHVLAVNDSTGGIDLAIHPTDSNVIYAAMWERVRRANYLNYGGPASGLFRSTDGGDTWHELVNGLPTGPDVGRIGISLCRDTPEILYAIYADASPGYFMGVYKTTDGGDSWFQTNDGVLSNVFSSYGWWFGNIRVDPVNPDRVFVLGLDFYRSTNGGASWSSAAGSMHVDHHGLDFTVDPSFIYEGNDGGMYLSTNGGTLWNQLPDLPATQFYTVEVDHQLPQRRYGGTQDNGTNRTLTGNLDDWHQILGGDGFYCQVDPSNNSYVYAEYQYGSLFRSVNGGGSFSSAQSGLNSQRNWSMPVMVDPSNPSTLYTGTDRVYRSTNRAQSWSAISGLLTNGPGNGNITFGTVTTVAVAETDPQVIWAGTDDGNVWVTFDGGGSWFQVDAQLPDRWVTRVAVDPTDATISYVTISGFRWDEPLPHVFRSTNFGASWTDVSSNLPEMPVNDLVVDPDAPSTLYVATDLGVYVTHDTGGNWTALGAALPGVVITDLELHQPTRTLVAATFGRSMWTYDLAATTAVAAAAGAPAPVVPRLAPVGPNPLTAGPATVRFTLPRAAEMSLKIYDATGRLVRVLADANQVLAAGEHVIDWDARDERGRQVAGGIYLVRLAGDGTVATRKVSVIR
ncbi:MAG: FlgD immunoglobulin-like domain containing protein [Candidatus Eiseniibacteriota bacterium]|jgi:photosystem II stability/assembly factor-like uncharacterized protein